MAVQSKHTRPAGQAGRMQFGYQARLVVVIAMGLVMVGPPCLAQSAAAQPVDSPVASGWRVGTGRAKITPTEPMWMAGYASRNAPSKDVELDLWAKALLMEDGQQNRLLLVTLDLIGIDRGLSGELCAILQQRFGLERGQIAISTSHTHSGPVVAKNLRPMHFYQLAEHQQQQVVDYSSWLIEQIVATAEQARSSLRPVQLQWGSGQATFATNRRNNPEPEVPRLRSSGQLNGPVDHSVPVLVAADENARPVAIVFGYACHATVLSGYSISGDYPGYAQQELENRYPDCTALFWAGCGGDQTPLPRRTVPLAQHYGRQLALAVESVLMTHALEPVGDGVQSQYREIDVPLAEIPDQQALVNQSQSSNIYEAMRARLLLEDLDGGQPLSPTYPYPVQSWRFADGPSGFSGRRGGGGLRARKSLRLGPQTCDRLRQ